MRAHRLIAGLALVTVFAASAPAFAAADPESIVRAMLLNTEARLQRRLERRGLLCTPIMSDPPFGCGVLTRLHIRIVRILENLEAAGSSRRSSSRASSSSSRAASSSSSSSAEAQRPLDPLADTVLSTSLFALFGDTTPIIASVRVFINEEPLEVTAIRITPTGATGAVEYFAVYDEQRRLVGRATRNGSDFVLPLSPGALAVPRREYRSFYVRAVLGDFARNADGADAFGVLTFTLEANGAWSNDAYTKAFSDTFPTVQPAAGTLVGLRNGGAQSEFLTDGTLDLFDLRGSADAVGHAQTRLSSLMFTVAKSDVTVSSATLTVIGSGVSSPCTVAATTVTCDAISSSIGTVNGDFRLVLQGAVTVTPGADNPRLQLFLQDPGSPVAAGDIAWTDGIADYTWVQSATPVVRGTYFTR